ncbi:MAG: GGDEF domain-containing protein [Lachnospiraceae bacterium]|nr:GGDEF domain-containing protein [Lachnospiraceae bacterium]
MNPFKKLKEISYHTYFDTKPLPVNERMAVTFVVFGLVVVVQFFVFIALNDAIIMFTSAIFTLIFFFCILHMLSRKNSNLSIRLLYYSGVLLTCIIDYILGERFLYSLYAIAMIPVMYYYLNLTYLGSAPSEMPSVFDSSELEPFPFGDEEEKKKTPSRKRRHNHKLIIESMLAGLYNLVVNIIFHFLPNSHEVDLSHLKVNDIDSIVSGINIILCILLLVHFSAVFVADVRRYQYLYERKNYELERFALYDPLMGVRNRQSINSDIDKMIGTAENEKTPLTIALADIDNFKNINDRYGHAQGDRILARLGSVFAELVPEDCIVCRWGGEEMLFVIPQDLEESKKLFNEIRHKLSTMEFKTDSEAFHITLTFGVETYTEGTTFDAMIQSADDSLYMGKQNGRDCIAYKNFFWRY